MDMNAPPPDDEELPSVVSELSIHSRSSNVEERRAAVEKLYELSYKTGPGIASAIPALIEALSDPDPKVGESALWALAYCKPHSVEPLSECLAHPQPLVRERAAHSLGNIGDEAQAALPALRELLVDGDQAVRRRGAWAIGLIHDTHPESVERLVRNVSLGTTEDKAAALHALGNIGKALDEASPLRKHQAMILACLRHESSDVRWSALFAMESAGLEPQAQADLLAEMVRHEPATRVLDAALSRLIKLAPTVDIGAHVNALTALISRPGPGGRQACEVLASMRPLPLEATGALIQALQVDAFVLPAASALWMMTGDARPLLPALERIFDEYDESVCDVIVDLGPAAAPLIPKLIDALSRENWDLQWAAADALGAVASPEPRVVEALIEALRHPSPVVRSASARALAKTGCEVVLQLQELLVGEPDGRGPWAAYALGEMGVPAAAALPSLREGMRSGVSPLANCCAIAVALVGGDAEALVHLESILQSDDPEAPRRAAASALGSLGPAARRSIPALEGLLGDEDFDVREAAEGALAAIRKLEQ